MRLDRNALRHSFEAAGMDEKRASYFADGVVESFVGVDRIDERVEWGLRRGFLPEEVHCYGLNELNWRQYLSDFDYFCMHPLNNHFAFWINDKLTLKYILSGMPEGGYLPNYYIYIENDGRFTYLMDMPEDIARDTFCIDRLLRSKGDLALKPNRGSGGEGFIHLRITEDGDVFANGRRADPADPRFLSGLKGFLVTDYVHQHISLAEIWSDSVCTLRVVMAKRRGINSFENGGYLNIVSYARFGASGTGSVSNVGTGGVAVPFDFETGEFADHGWREVTGHGEDWFVDRHPDTGIAFAGRSVPFIKEIRRLIFDVCSYISTLDYFGFDIMIDNAGPVLCEINSLPGLKYDQVNYGPILARPEVDEFYSEKRSASYKRDALYDSVIASILK